MNMEPILWKKWKASRYETEPDVIIGEWAEDGNHYIIKVPVQLRDMIVQLQNDAVDEKLAKEPKKEKCNCCNGHGYHVIPSLEKQEILYNKNTTWTTNEGNI